MFSGSPLFILTLTCLTKDAENVSKMLKPRSEKVPAAPTRGLVGVINIACKYAFDGLEKESISLCKNGLRCFESVKDR